MTFFNIYLGWDPREVVAYDVAVASIRAHTVHDKIHALHLPSLRQLGLYTRPTIRRGAQLWDLLSDAPMSTEHAMTRFLVPQLQLFHGWAVFADCDVLLRADIQDLFALADDRYAVQVVQHDYTPTSATKMDGQIQTVYPRKLWSSVILWNCAHPAHRALLTIVNQRPGRDLHRFCWLRDSEIGALPLRWNYLVGISPPTDDVALAHFTLGIPSMPGYEACEFADEWQQYAAEVAPL